MVVWKHLLTGCLVAIHVYVVPDLNYFHSLRTCGEEMEKKCWATYPHETECKEFRPWRSLYQHGLHKKTYACTVTGLD